MGRCFLTIFVRVVSLGWYVVTRDTRRCCFVVGGAVGPEYGVSGLLGCTRTIMNIWIVYVIFECSHMIACKMKCSDFASKTHYRLILDGCGLTCHL